MRNLVTRKEWGAQRPRHRTALPPEAVRFMVVHYTASDADEQASHSNCAARVKGIQTFHMGPQRGWSDIAYNWVFCKHGYIYRGRGWGVKSAATGDANSYTVAACFLGDDTANRDDVTAAGRKALEEIWAFCLRHGPNISDARGHRDFMSTACPGDQLYRFALGLQK